MSYINREELMEGLTNGSFNDIIFDLIMKHGLDYLHNNDEDAVKDFASDLLISVRNRISTEPEANVSPVLYGHRVIHERHRGAALAVTIICPHCQGTFEYKVHGPYTEKIEYCSECHKKLDDTFQNACPNCAAVMIDNNSEE